MKKIFFTVLMFFAGLYAADWKFVSIINPSEISYLNINSNETWIEFYDDSSIHKLDNGNITVWIKCFKSDTGTDTSVIKKAASKLLEGYVPPYARINGITTLKNQVSGEYFGAVYSEILANMNILIEKAIILFEFESKNNKYRTLSIRFYDNKSDTDNKEGDWMYISPESINERLFKMLLVKNKK